MQSLPKLVAIVIPAEWCRVLAVCASHCWEGPARIGCAGTPIDTGSGCKGGNPLPWPWTSPSGGSIQTHAQQSPRPAHSPCSTVLPKLQRKGGVYIIPCDQCPQCYVSQTGWSLEQHRGEHCRALRKGDVLASAVAEHVFVLGHQMDLSKARVTGSHPHTQTQCLLESWHIQREQAPLNREKGTLLGLHHSAGMTMATNLGRLCMLWLPYY